MSTTTRRAQQKQREDHTPTRIHGRRLPNWLLILLVFVGGAASLAVEMAASRLLAPYFGTSLFVWADIIGLILLYLTVGYYVGGLLADRYPNPRIFYGIAGLAAVFIGLIPLLAHPILSWAVVTFATDPTNSLGIFYGSLVSIILLFAIPTILLGCVSPYAIRLSIVQVGKSGHTAGRLYAISTVGSIVGTFLPVLVLLPDIGTNLTILSFAGALMLISVAGSIFWLSLGLPFEKLP